jgi:SAM-dependent methyltransferase
MKDSVPGEPTTEGMRRYWDDRAKENAAWYVDTSCSYDDPDMDQFWATGEQIVKESYVDAPVRPDEHRLAVEIGPGLGRVCKALAQHFDRVIGVDVSPEMVTRARELVDDPRITFEVGNGGDLRPAEDGSADLVVTFTVFQHLPEQAMLEGYIRDAARVLSPGGVLAAQWNNLPHPRLWRIQGQWWRILQRLGLKHRNDHRVAPQFLGSRVTVAAVRAMCERAGLVPQATKGEGTLFAWVWATKA